MSVHLAQLILPEGFVGVSEHSSPLLPADAYIAVAEDGVVSGGCFSESVDPGKWFGICIADGAQVLRGPRAVAVGMLGDCIALTKHRTLCMNSAKALNERQRHYDRLHHIKRLADLSGHQVQGLPAHMREILTDLSKVCLKQIDEHGMSTSSVDLSDVEYLQELDSIADSAPAECAQ